MNQLRLRTPADAIRFLIDFARLDVETARRSETRARVHAFLHGPKHPGMVSVADVLQCHKDAGAVLAAITTGTPYHATLALTFSVARPQRLTRLPTRPMGDPGYLAEVLQIPRELSPRVFVAADADSPSERFVYYVIRLFESAGVDKIQACPECRRLFFRVTR